MKFATRLSSLVLRFLMCISSSGMVVAGEAYPSKPVRVILPFPPASATDVALRLMAPKLSEILGRPFIIENIPGAGGNIATGLAAKEAPDGYTLLSVPPPFAINPSLFKKVPYDPQKDFAPVILAMRFASVLVVNSALRVDSVETLIAVAKKNPGKLNYASGGNGTIAHLSAELFRGMAGIDIVHVPYKGPAAGVTALLAGDVSLMFPTAPPALTHIKSGRLTALAVTGAKRSALLPQVPTVAEAGLPGFEADAWLGVVVPAGTPGPVIARLNSAFARTLETPEIGQQLLAQGAETIGGSPDEFRAFLKAELEKWAKVVKRTGATVD